jgi:hypothetical protein
MSNELIQKKQEETQKSKLLHRYQCLIRDIELRKKQHENLNEGIRVAIPKVQNELQPLQDELLELEVQKLLRLDEVFQEIVLPKMKSEFFVEWMIDELEVYLSGSFENHAELNLLYKKYAKRDFEKLRVQNEYYAKLIKNETGYEADPKEIGEKGFHNYIKEKWGVQKAEPKKKSKKKQKAEELESIEDKMLAADAKAIYFRLIKKYHPDLQQDPAMQLVYTEITKKVTIAYKNQDFLALLLLQIEYLDENEIDGGLLADEMLKRYNKILQNQLREINRAVEILKNSSKGMFEAFFEEDYKFSERLFEQKKAALNKDIDALIDDLNNSIDQKKGWFKEWIRVNQVIREESERVVRF